VPLILAAGSALDANPFELAEAAAAAGFDGFGLRLSDQHRLDDPQQFRRQLERLGVGLHDAEVIRLGSRIDPQPLIEAAAAAGAAAVLAVSDTGDRDATVDGVGSLVEQCERLGLVVGLEYMAWTDPTSPEEAIAIAGATGCVVVVDVLHHVRVGADRTRLEAVLASGCFGWLQLCDAGRRSVETSAFVDEARHRRCAPGDGTLPLGDLLAAFGPSDRADLEHVVSVEVQSDAMLDIPLARRVVMLHETADRVLANAHASNSTG
jgi:sugar phosphate isomerase/epimerase